MREFTRGWRTAVPAAIVAAAGICAWSGATPTATAAPDRPRIGVFFHERSPDVADALEGLRDGADLAGRFPIWIESAGGTSDASAHQALVGLVVENVDVVIAIGDRAAQRARDVVRDRAVVFTGVGNPDLLGLRSGRLCGTASAPPAADLLRLTRRGVLDLRSVALLVPDEDPATAGLFDDLHRAAARASRLGRHPLRTVRVAGAGATPAERAAAAARDLPDGCQALWLPRAVQEEDAAALAEELEGRGILLAGSRRAHLDAGCAVVLRADDRRLAARALGLAFSVLDGADPGALPRRAPRRFLVEVNLTACHRLGVELPLALIASADRVTPPYGVGR